MTPSEPRTFVKSRAGAPDGFFDAEVAGLRWLAQASTDGGVDVVRVLAHDASSVTLERVKPGTPQQGRARAAREFGRALAVTHAAGADRFGTLPPTASRYFFGPLQQPLRLPSTTSERFGRFYADARLRPVLGGVDLGRRERDLAERVCRALDDGAADRWPDGSVVQPARVHGDLWSGNVMWTAAGAVVIDPAACGHHPLADLAMLTLFGAPHLDGILEAYAEAAHLPPRWRELLPLHQLFGWLVHLRLFGAGYAAPTIEALEGSAHLLGA